MFKGRSFRLRTYQRDRDGHVGDENQRIGDEVQPNEPRHPPVAVPLRHEIAACKQPLQEFHGNTPDRLRLAAPTRGNW